MPKTPINYKNGIIYKIQHLEKLELLYVGSTTEFTKRKNRHKDSCTKIFDKGYNFPLYKMIRDNGGWIQFKMIIIKEYPCNSKTELLIEEDRLMMELKSNMNTHKASRGNITRKEYIKNYYLENNDLIKEQRNTKCVCECGGDYTHQNKARHLKTIKHQEFISQIV